MKIRPATPWTQKAAFTLMEMLVVISIIALLISLLVPAVQSTLVSAQEVKCLSNLRRLAQGFQLYTNENRGAIPRSNAGTAGDKEWKVHIGALFAGKTHDEYDQANAWRTDPLFVCPGSNTPQTGAAIIQYGMNQWFDPGMWGPRSPVPVPFGNFSLHHVGNPSNTILFGDKTLLWHAPIINYSGTRYHPDPRHRGRAHFVYVDGHVGKLTWPNFLDADLYEFMN